MSGRKRDPVWVHRILTMKMSPMLTSTMKLLKSVLLTQIPARLKLLLVHVDIRGPAKRLNTATVNKINQLRIDTNILTFKLQ
jgi:hypothetical protein